MIFGGFYTLLEVQECELEGRELRKYFFKINFGDPNWTVLILSSQDPPLEPLRKQIASHAISPTTKF